MPPPKTATVSPICSRLFRTARTATASGSARAAWSSRSVGGSFTHMAAGARQYSARPPSPESPSAAICSQRVTWWR